MSDRSQNYFEVVKAVADGIRRCEMTDETEEDRQACGWGRATDLVEGGLLIEWRGKPYRLGITLENL